MLTSLRGEPKDREIYQRATNHEAFVDFDTPPYIGVEEPLNRGELIDAAKSVMEIAEPSPRIDGYANSVVNDDVGAQRDRARYLNQGHNNEPEV